MKNQATRRLPCGNAEKITQIDCRSAAKATGWQATGTMAFR
jgi:hypothetical protein